MPAQRAFRDRVVHILLGFTSALLFTSASAQPASEPPALNQSLLDELRQGGFVIYFRHAQTELSNVPDSTENITRCETQRNLSAAGRKTAREIGRAFKKLRIPVGEVKTSPFCRCKDTARLAFGSYAVDRNLYFALNIEADARKRFAEITRKMLATPPAQGTNTIIVSHTANLREATGYWPKPEGTAYIFRPGDDGSFVAVARVEPADWQALASTQQRP